jgi:xanthine dehydrogenase YagR molybdenum-binding subunit
MNQDKQDNKDSGILGAHVERVDAFLKVTGGAKYAAEFTFPNLAHTILVQSTIASGRITDIDISEAEKLSGVLKIIFYKNVPRLARPTNRLRLRLKIK